MSRSQLQELMDRNFEANSSPYPSISLFLALSLFFSRTLSLSLSLHKFVYLFKCICVHMHVCRIGMYSCQCVHARFHNSLHIFSLRYCNTRGRFHETSTDNLTFSINSKCNFINQLIQFLSLRCNNVILLKLRSIKLRMKLKSERKEKRKKTERKRSYVYNHRVDNVRK